MDGRIGAMIESIVDLQDAREFRTKKILTLEECEKIRRWYLERHGYRKPAPKGGKQKTLGL